MTLPITVKSPAAVSEAIFVPPDLKYSTPPDSSTDQVVPRPIVPVNDGDADRTVLPVPVDVVTPVPPLATGRVPVTPDVKLTFVIVLLEPLMVLLVRVSAPAKVAKVPVVGNVTEVVLVAVRVVANAPDVVRLPPKVIVLPELAMPVPPLAPSNTPDMSALPTSIASQPVFVPSDFKYLPLALVWDGTKALNAALAVIWPVPPLVIGTTPPTVWGETS